MQKKLSNYRLGRTNNMHRQNKPWVILLLVNSMVLLSGCWSLRSAEGLKEGELNINYVAPVAGSVRYGIIDNIEARFTLAGEATTYDIFVHTNNDSSSNYGVYIGNHRWWFNGSINYEYMGFVYSKRLSKYFNPYASIYFMSDHANHRINYEGSYYSLGAELEIPLFERFTILITPEVGRQIKYTSGGDFNTRGWSATGNVGFIIKLY
jgi:hypothetical protein